MVGLSKINRVGVAPDASGESYLCYQGSKRQLDLLGSAPGVEWWTEWNCLALPMTRTNVLLLETIGQFEEAFDEYVAVRSRLLKAPSKFAQSYPEPAAGEPPPYPHQLEAFCWARQCFENGGGGFANLAEMGLGKTRMAIDLMRFYVFQKALVVVQNSTALQWRQHLERSWPQATPLMLTDMPVEKRLERLVKAPTAWPLIAVVNWESLSRMTTFLKNWRPEMIVLDEASRIKERNTKMAKAAHRLADGCPYRLAMTGTPMGNSPADIWSIFRFVEPELFGKSYWRFAETYFRLGGFTGREFVAFQPQSLHGFIDKLYFQSYRITKAAAVAMPEKQFEVIRLPMSPEQSALYRQMADDLYAKRINEQGEEEVLTAASALDQAIRLQQVTSGLFPVNGDGEPYCLPIKSAKTEWLVDYVKDKLETTDAHLVIWTRYVAERKRVCEALLAAGIPDEALGYIDGSVKNEAREQLRQEFNDRSHPRRVLVCQIQACSYGLDIPAADCLAYHSGTFSLLERNQSIERGHRLGRSRPYSILDLVCEDSIDEKILKAIDRKQNLADMLLMDGLPTHP